MVKCFKRHSPNLGYAFFFVSPTDEYYAVFISYTQRFSVGHFWSPFHATIEGVFCKLFINAEDSTSYKYSVSISCKIPHFHAIRLILTSIYNNTTITGLGTETEKVERLSPFFVSYSCNSLVCWYIKIKHTIKKLFKFISLSFL